MSKQSSNRSQHQSPDILPGLVPAIRMKGGVRYDPQAGGFFAIVHSWDNALGIGQPKEWRYPQAFPTEDAAMSYYKTNIRPGLEQIMADAAKSNIKVRQRRLEE